MIALDTNVLARFYCVDPTDEQAAIQRPIAKRILENSSAVFVAKTVILELEWVMRGFYRLASDDFCAAVTHLIGLPNVTVEDWPSIVDALAWHQQGLDFADALHLAASQRAENFVTFDDKKFARRSRALDLKPAVTVPK